MAPTRTFPRPGFVRLVAASGAATLIHRLETSSDGTLGQESACLGHEVRGRATRAARRLCESRLPPCNEPQDRPWAKDLTIP